MGPRVLVVEDETSISEPLASHLTREGFEPEVAGTLAAAREAISRDEPDVILLDVMLPDGDGRDFCRDVRAHSDVPIVMLTARGEEVDRIVGLELGGDDYVGKPFSPRELVARVRACLRRAAAPPPEQPTMLRHGRLALDTEQYKAFWDDQELVLTLTEFGILRTLLTRPGKICSRDHLMDQAYELHKVVSDRTIDSHVRRVRSKFAAIGADPIETVHGIGYKLGLCQ
jgi:two-component system OmpR family response regulator